LRRRPGYSIVNFSPMRSALALLAVFCLASRSAAEKPPAPEGAPFYVFTVTGAIDPVIGRYLSDGLEKAAAESAAAALIRLDTPGGLLDATRDIVQDVLNAPFPVVVYVSPRGARAASAGVFITLAADVAAMSPQTHLGAAHPVSIGGGPLGGVSKSTAAGGAAEEKAVSDAAAYARALAASKGRNADWAERAVRESLSLTSEEALEKGVIDAVAADEGELLKLLQGREIVKNGRTLVLDLQNARTVPFELSRTRRLLHALANPNIAYLLLMLGFYALIYEFASPGVGMGAAVGVVSLALAFFALQVLPLNYAALLLLVTGMAMMAAELFVASHGLLMAGGALCFAVGSFLLFDSPEPYLRVSFQLIGGTVLTTLAFLLFVVKKVLAVRRLPSVTGREGMIGKTGEARPEGMVFVHGELWMAETEAPLTPGDKVRVEGVRGNRLLVRKI
jgi:membrane-bound serine protease (ClpP class)